jgi:hypothetical protein
VARHCSHSPRLCHRSCRRPSSYHHGPQSVFPTFSSNLLEFRNVSASSDLPKKDASLYPDQNPRTVHGQPSTLALHMLRVHRLSTCLQLGHREQHHVLFITAISLPTVGMRRPGQAFCRIAAIPGATHHPPVTVDRTEYHFLTTFLPSRMWSSFWKWNISGPIIGRTIRPHNIVLNSLSLFFIELNYDSKNQTGGSIYVLCVPL